MGLLEVDSREEVTHLLWAQHDLLPSASSLLRVPLDMAHGVRLLRPPSPSLCLVESLLQDRQGSISDVGLRAHAGVELLDIRRRHLLDPLRANAWHDWHLKRLA
jgi:hypothetical protein